MSLDEHIMIALRSAWQSGTWSHYDGPASTELQYRLTNFCGRRHARLTSSGTIAVELALRGVGVRAGDEVILGGYDFPGNFRAIEAIGARPVLVDSRPNDWCIEPSTLNFMHLRTL